MKKQILATAMAIVSVGSLNLTTPTAASCKPLDASIIEINEQNNSELEVSVYHDPRFDNLMKQVEDQKRKNQIEAARKAEEKRQLELKKEQERIDNVKFDSYDIGVPSGITHEEMANVLKGSGFEEFSDAFVDAERAYGVNAFALAAIPGLESGWNRSGRAHDGGNNIVGMNVPHNASRGSVYNSKYQCIMDLARQLRTYYLTPGATYYNGVSTSKVNIKYSAATDWYKQVDTIGDELMQKYRQLYR
jgi:hypothetical protein